MTPTATDVYGLALAGGPAKLRARRPDGSVQTLALDRWLGPLTAADEALLDRARSPVLDVGCGPGRHVLALARRGRMALGVDVAPAAVRVARLRGAAVIEGSVFARIPGAGTWGSALLLDGNIGIGGAPDALLARLRRLLRPDGEVLVELAPPGAATTRERIRLEFGDQHSRPFAWAYVGVDAVQAPASAAGFAVAEHWQDERRWFARLVATARR
ncbi:MAG: methyltransferase domain-containing protein [Thermoleophilia bacterium]